MDGQIVGFYDGSKAERNRKVERITLAGYAAKPDVWRDVETVWWRVLGDDAVRPACRYLHMVEANSLSNEFAIQKGWTKARVDSLLNDLSNRCLGPFGAREPIEDSLVGAACTVEIDDYLRAQQECPYLQGMTPEEVCVNYVAEVALKLLPESPTGIFGKSGSVELYFDQGERFMRTLVRPWQKKRSQRPVSLKLVHKIATASSRDRVGLQAADFLAWHANRDFWKRGVGHKDLILRGRMIAAGLASSDLYDYAKLIARYKNWPARDANGHVPPPQ